MAPIGEYRRSVPRLGLVDCGTCGVHRVASIMSARLRRVREAPLHLDSCHARYESSLRVAQELLRWNLSRPVVDQAFLFVAVVCPRPSLHDPWRPLSSAPTEEFRVRGVPPGMHGAQKSPRSVIRLSLAWPHETRPHQSRPTSLSAGVARRILFLGRTL